MEGSESEAIFESMNVNPQLFINTVLNSVDDLLDGAFDHFHQEASAQLKIEGTDRAQDLSHGVASIRKMIQLALDKRLTMWEKYCLHRCFAVPPGFSLPKANEPSGDVSIDVDAFIDPELDAQLDSLRGKLTLVGKESAELNRELQEVEKQSVLSNHEAGSINEALQLYEQYSLHDMFQELARTALELRPEVEKLKTKSAEEANRSRIEKVQANGELFSLKLGNGLSNATLKELEEFIADLRTE